MPEEPADSSVPADDLVENTATRPVVLADRLAGEQACTRRAVEILGELLTDAAASVVSAEQFRATALRTSPSNLESVQSTFSVSSGLSIAAVLADLVATHRPTIGPADYDQTPRWARFDLHDQVLSVPDLLSAHFAAGTLAEVDLVISISYDRDYMTPEWEFTVYCRVDDREHAQRAMDAILETARRTKNFYRGRAVSVDLTPGLTWTITDVPRTGRSKVIIPDSVWAELDLNIAAVTDRAELMRRAGLGTRRGVLLAGPPGVGKSAVGQVVAAELAGDFTVIFIEARAGQGALRTVFRETQDLGPTVIILEDIDLYLGERRQGGGSALADFLAVMDGAEEYDRVLTIGTTNDPTVLDAAAVRSARFDSIITLDYPDTAACAAILHRYLAEVGDLEINTQAVAASLPSQVSGADLREMVRRGLLAWGERLSTERMIDTVRDGRWKPAPLIGSYL